MEKRPARLRASFSIGSLRTLKKSSDSIPTELTPEKVEDNNQNVSQNIENSENIISSSNEITQNNENNTPNSENIIMPPKIEKLSSWNSIDFEEFSSETLIKDEAPNFIVKEVQVNQTHICMSKIEQERPLRQKRVRLINNIHLVNNTDSFSKE